MASDLSASRALPDRGGATSAAWRAIRATAPAHASLALTAALLAAALVPTWLTPIPAMVDYVNHLARMHLMAGGAEASPFYRIAWGLYPNLAMDLLVPPLAGLTGVETATRLFLLASQVLIVSGAAALELAVKRRLAIAGPIAILFLFSAPFAWGFLNFEFALGIALWGIAAWVALADRGWTIRLATHSVVVALLFIGHFFALGLYGFTIGVHELWSARNRGTSPTALAGTMALLAAPATAVVGVMLATGGTIGDAGTDWGFATKPLWPFAILNGFSLGLSGVEAGWLILLVYALWRAAAVRHVASGRWLTVGFAALFVAVPSRLLDTAFSDVRVLLAAALILPAFLDIAFPSPRWRATAAAIVCGCALINIGTAAVVFVSTAPTYRAMIASFARLGSGARVLVARNGNPVEDPPMTHLADYPLYHAPTLAAPYAKAFVPTLFASPGKQPLAVVPALRDMSYSCRGPVPVSDLVSLANGAIPHSAPAFVRRWTHDFDYLYLIGDGSAPNPLPTVLEPVQRNARFVLYRIGTSAPRPQLSRTGGR